MVPTQPDMVRVINSQRRPQKSDAWLTGGANTTKEMVRAVNIQPEMSAPPTTEATVLANWDTCQHTCNPLDQCFGLTAPAATS
jgi:hypothetical protein